MNERKRLLNKDFALSVFLVKITVVKGLLLLYIQFGKPAEVGVSSLCSLSFVTNLGKIVIHDQLDGHWAHVKKNVQNFFPKSMSFFYYIC